MKITLKGAKIYVEKVSFESVEGSGQKRKGRKKRKSEGR